MRSKYPETGDAPLSLRRRLAAGWARFQQEHPALYASRHVVLATLKVALPFLGLGALLTALLPAIDWSWLREAAAYLRSLLPDVDIALFWRPDREPGFKDSPIGQTIRWIVPRVKWVVPIVIAIFVAIEEVERRKRKHAAAPDEPPAAPQGRDAE